MVPIGLFNYCKRKEKIEISAIAIIFIDAIINYIKHGAFACETVSILKRKYAFLFVEQKYLSVVTSKY